MSDFNFDDDFDFNIGDDKPASNKKQNNNDFTFSDDFLENDNPAPKKSGAKAAKPAKDDDTLDFGDTFDEVVPKPKAKTKKHDDISFGDDFDNNSPKKSKDV